MKPTKPVRGIFLLTVFKILLAGAFLVAFLKRGVEPEKAQMIAYTLGAYIALAIPTFVSIHRFGATAVRSFIVLALMASLPARAYLAIVLDAVALWLSFRPGAVAYFASSSKKRDRAPAQT